jgi:prolyl oligopeptidase
VIQEGDDVETEIDMGHDGLLYMFTNRDAPRRRIVVADPTAPQPGDWRELVAESDAVLLGFVLTDDAVVVSSTRQAVAAVDVYDRATGAHRAAVPLPGLGAIVGLTASPDGGDDVYIGYTDFVTPPEVHHYSVAAGAIEVWEHAPGARAGSPAVLARQVEYPSKDGTAVPMFVIARDDITPGTPRPTVLNGYGGFNIAMTPGYSAALLTWVECGGIYAVACLRGGSERGETWHRAGMREHKQNVFDDFAAAADWLVGEGWTSPQRLAISGGSNGGLLVGAALTQWPEKYAAVMCSAPLLDMIRYERYGLGVTWNDEYGTADDPVEFGWLLGYSPYHRVVEGTAYPAVLFTVFESDTRVDPFHARKMAAALQHATSSDQPILLRRERDVGHAARSISRTVDLAVDTMSFLADRCGLDVEPG